MGAKGLLSVSFSATSGDENDRKPLEMQMGAEGRRHFDAIGESILAKIRSHAEGDPSSIGHDTQLADLGIHSLELTEIIFDLEEEFGIEIEMNTAQAWENLESVGDIAEAVRALVSAKT